MNMPIATSLGRIGVLAPIVFCSACAPMSGAWYYQTADSQDSKDSTNLYLAIINDTGKERDIRALEVNTAKRGCALSWSCEPPGQYPPDAPKLLPGQLLVVALPTSGAFQCAIPTHGRVVLARGGKRDLQLPRSMPSALPEAWRLACIKAKHDSNGAPNQTASPALVCSQRVTNCDDSGGAHAHPQ